MIDNLFINNPICKTIIALVNFCNEFTYLGQRKLKFLKKMPLNKKEDTTMYSNRFIFDSTKISGVNLK